jgi:hypothetical protein
VRLPACDPAFLPPQVVRTTVEPIGHSGRNPGVHYDAYEYLANHHSYKRDEHPTVKITYNLSPLQVGLHGTAADVQRHHTAQVTCSRCVSDVCIIVGPRVRRNHMLACKRAARAVCMSSAHRRVSELKHTAVAESLLASITTKTLVAGGDVDNC